MKVIKPIFFLAKFSSWEKILVIFFPFWENRAQKKGKIETKIVAEKLLNSKVAILHSLLCRNA
jgi:hypothetical protein